MGRRRFTLALLAGATFATATVARAVEYAPLDRPGPALTPSAADLAASLKCPVPIEGAQRDPVLLLAGTTVNSDENFAWNYERALTSEKIPFCVLDEPPPLDLNLGDVQLRGEYIVNALRVMHARSGRKTAVYGHSQGGMVTRWALRFWPDTRALVSDVIGAAPSNHGTLVAVAACTPQCPAANWQQRTDAQFIAALNSRAETFAGIDYTAIYSHNDEIVVPYTGAQLSGPGRITNVAVQDVCPLDVSEHLNIGTADAVTWALFKDAIDHDGPADPKRIDPGVCSTPFMPGVDQATVATDMAQSYSALALNLASYPQVGAEPALACYVMDPSTCPPPPVPPVRCWRTVHLPRNVRSAVITVDGHRVAARRLHGRLIVRMPIRGDSAHMVVRGRTRGGHRFLLTHSYACRAA